jgi:hypothetical protein
VVLAAGPAAVLLAFAVRALLRGRRRRLDRIIAAARAEGRAQAAAGA